MSQTLILELSDEVYTTIRRQAESAGTSPAHWLATTLEQQYGPRHAWQSALQPTRQGPAAACQRCQAFAARRVQCESAYQCCPGRFGLWRGRPEWGRMLWWGP